MIKHNLILSAVIILTIILLCILFSISVKSDNSKNAEFLKAYGWEIEKKPVEKSEFQIPEYFDDIYLNYNKLQLEAGLDLTPYRGYFAVRYTYPVKNFPFPEKNDVFANVICIDGTPIAGDICTYALDGFMYSLNFNTQSCIKNDGSIAFSQ